MNTKRIRVFFKSTILLMVVLGLSTCNSTKRATSTSNMFKIPKKIVNAEDLPQQVKETEQNRIHYVQLFPDEKPAGEFTEAIKAEPEKEIVIVSNEMTEIEKHVDEVVKTIVQNRVKPIFYHIVSGSFKSKINADRFAGYLKNIGYGNTYVRFFDNGFNRVIVQRYSNEVEARQYLQGYRTDNPIYADAWLYYNKDYNDDPMAYFSN